MLAKVNKISTIFSSLTDTVTRPPGLINIEKLNKQNAQAVKTQPQNPEEFYNRVSSFRPGLWTVQELTPLECARWGWRVQEKDILQCITCREVVCAILPDIRDFKAYEKYLGLLKSRIVEAHKDACGWKHNPSPEEFVQPPYIGSIEDMRNLTNSARTLAALNSALPYLDIGALSDSLGADRDLILGLFQNDSTDYEVQASSVLLVLSGWIRGEGAYIRCKVCRRSVGLWSFITRADELERARAISPAPTPSGKRKRNEEQVEETVEDEEMDQDNSEGPSPAGSRICPPRKCKLLKTDNKGSDSGEKINEENNTAGEEDERKEEENVQKEQEKEMEDGDVDKEKENGQKAKTIAIEAEGEKTNEGEVQEKMEEGSPHNENNKENNSDKEMDSEKRRKMEEGDEKERDKLQEEAETNNNSEEKENEAINNRNEDEKKEEQKKEKNSETGKNESLAENKTEENESEKNKGSDNEKSGEMAAENKEDDEKTVNADSESEEKRHTPDNSDASEDSKKDSPKDVDTKTSQTEKDKQDGGETADKEEEEENPEEINSTGDKEQGSKEMSRVQDSCTSQKKSVLPSPLIIGSSPSTQIRKIGEKQYFHPLEEHRHWCTWTMKILLEEIDEEMSLEKRGYQMVTEQARDILDFASRKDLCSSEKYIRNVEGLRSIRTMLNGLASVDTWLSEDIAEK